MDNTPTAPLTEESAETEDFILPPKEDEELIEHYELLLLISGLTSEDDAAKVFTSVKELLANDGAQITHEESLGRKALGYTIAKSRQGHYFVAEFDLVKSKLAPLQQKLRVRADITRYLIVKKRVKTAAELAEEARVRQKIEARKKARVKEDIAKLEEATSVTPLSSALAPATTTSESPSATTPTTPKASVEEGKTKEKTPSTLEDIDKEIEKILSDDFDV